MSDSYTLIDDQQPLAAPQVPSAGGYTLLEDEPARINAVTAPLTAPDQAGSSIKQSAATGVPASIINADPKGFAAEQSTTAASRAIDENGFIAAFIGESEMNAAAAQGDYENLERSSKSLTTYLEQSLTDFVLNNHKNEISALAAIKKGVTEAYKEPLGFSMENQIKQPSLVLWQPIMAGLDFLFRIPAQALPYALGELAGELYRQGGGEEGMSQRLRRDIAQIAQVGQVATVPGMKAPPAQAVKPYSTMSVEEFLSLERGVRTRKEIDEFLRAKADPVVLQISNAEIDARNLTKAVETAQTSALRERAPTAFENFVAKHTDGEVGLNPQKLVELYQAEGKTPAKGDGLFGYVPDLDRKIATALETGTDVMVPVSQYVTYTDPALHGKIEGAVRHRPEGVTIEEAKELVKAEPKAVEEKKSAFPEIDAEKALMGLDRPLLFAIPNKEKTLEKIFSEETDLSLPKNAARAMDEWVGGDAKSRTTDTTGVFSPRKIEDAYSKIPTEEGKIVKKELDEAFAPLREELRSIYGDKITLYRVQGEVGGKTRNVLSWTLDNTFADRYAGVLKEKPQFAENEIAAFEKEFNEKGVVKIGRYSLEKGDFGIEIMDPSVGGFVTDTPSVREFVESINTERKELAEKNKKNKEKIITMDIPLDDIIWVTDRFNQKEFLVKTEHGEKPLFFLTPPKPANKATGEAGTDIPLPGMTRGDWNLYSKRVEEAQRTAFDKAAEKAEKIEKRRQTAEWKKEEAELRQQVETDLRSRADIVVDNFLRIGELPTGEKARPVKLDAEAVARLGGQYIDKKFLDANGVHPDEIAPFLNYESGAALVRDLDILHSAYLAGNETPLAYRRRVAEQETEARMLEKYGDLQENIVEEARRAALSDIHVDLVAMETKALAKEAGAHTMGKDDLAAWVGDNFAKMPLKEAANIKQFQTASGRQATLAERALLKQDYEEAFKAKQRQLTSVLYAKESARLGRVMRSTNRIVDRFKDAVVPSVEQNYTNQIHKLMLDAGLRPRRSPQDINETVAAVNLNQFGMEQAALGAELSLPEFVLQGRMKPVEQMTVAEFREFAEGLQSLAHAGREAKKIQVGKEKQEFDDFKVAVIANIRSLPPVQHTRPQGLSEAASKRWEAAKRRIDVELVKMESVIDDLDLQDFLGPLNQAVLRPIQDGKALEQRKMLDLQTAVKGMKQSWAWRRTLSEFIPQDFLMDPRVTGAPQPMVLQRKDVINIALNLGTQSNIRKLVLPYAGNAPMAAASLEFQLKKLVSDTLTKEDWNYVQSIWKMFEKQWPDVKEMYRELAGVAPEEVKPVKVQTAFGEIDGSYFPMIYDKIAGREGSMLGVTEAVFDNNYYRPTTRNGYTKARTGFKDFVEIRDTPEQVISKAAQTIHDISYRRAVLNANKVIFDPDIQSAVRDHYGPEYAHMMQSWIKRVANRPNTNDEVLSFFNNTLRVVRQNATIASLGLNIPVLLAADVGRQLGGIGGVPKALTSWLRKSPDEAMSEWRFAHEKSKELDFTKQNIDRDLYEQLTKIGERGLWGNFQQAVAHYAFVPQSGISQLFRVVTWMDSYKAAIKEGKSEADAVFIADKNVRRDHGTAHPIDLSAMLSQTSETHKILTMFQTFLGHSYNRVRDIPRQAREGDWRGAAATAFSFIGVVALMNLLFDRKTQDESWPAHIAKNLFTLPLTFHPLVNAVISVGVEGYQNRTPISGLAQAGRRAITDWYRNASGQRTTNREIYNTMMLAGLMLGLPATQPARTIQFLADVSAGRQRPRSEYEWIRGLVYGRIEERKR